MWGSQNSRLLFDERARAGSSAERRRAPPPERRESGAPRAADSRYTCVATVTTTEHRVPRPPK